MKMYEMLGMNADTEEGIVKVIDFDCPRRYDFKVTCEFDGDREDCITCVKNFLLSEVPMKKVKREDALTMDELKNIVKFNFPKFNSGDCHRCTSEDGCSRSSNDCFIHWLEEEIEVVDEESLTKIYFKNKAKYRWQTIESNDDVIRLNKEFSEYCEGATCSNKCKYAGIAIDNCFVNFLMGEVD